MIQEDIPGMRREISQAIELVDDAIGKRTHGFAVVASEVRNLAHRSAAAAESMHGGADMALIELTVH